MTKIVIPPDFTTDDALAVPSAVSHDGTFVAGTIAIRANGIFRPVAAFRWSAGGGMTVIQTPDYLSAMATAISADGSMVVGNVAEPFSEAPQGPLGWVWTESSGIQYIPLPDGVTTSLALDIDASGTYVVGSFARAGTQVRDIFVWSAANGFVDLARGSTRVQVLPVGISADGHRIAFNCTDIEEGGCNGEGTGILENGPGPWSVGTLALDPVPRAQSVAAYTTSSLTTGEFGFYQAHSADLEVLAGYAVVKSGDVDFALPSLWLGPIGQVDVLAGAMWNGFGAAVSPDGTVASFTRHYGVGSDYAHVWTASSGDRELRRLLETADADLGSNLIATFGPGFGIVGPLRAFSADNSRAAGAVVCYECPASDLFGYVIDAFDLVLP